MEKLRNLLKQCLGQNFAHMIISNPRKSDVARKIDVRPYEDHGNMMFQFAEYRNKQVFHRNLSKDEAVEWTLGQMAETYRQMEIRTFEKQVTVLVSKKGKVTIKSRPQQQIVRMDLTHNRKKRYILPEDEPVPFLVELGV